jgi:hypothetical protein
MDIRRIDLNSFLISYRGHGMTEHATSSNSIGHVVNHELRHLAEFESRAKARNLDVIKEDITLRYQFIDGKIIAVAGKATMIAREKSAGNNLAPPDYPKGSPDSISAGSQTVEGIPNNMIDRLVKKVESALSKIESRLEAYYETDTSGQLEGSLNKIELEIKKEKLESKLAELKSKRLEITQKEILGGLSELTGDASNLLNAIYALKSGNENSKSSDKYSKIDVPDYPMQYTGLMLDTMI